MFELSLVVTISQNCSQATGCEMKASFHPQQRTQKYGAGFHEYEHNMLILGKIMLQICMVL